MAWKWIKAFVCLSMCVTSAVGNEEASCKKCADFNNPTWLEYRLGTKLKVQYILLTRNNADCASLFTQDCLNHTQKHTPYFNSSLPTKVIVHGYRALGSKPSWVSGLAKALLQEEDMNVLVVNWVYIASFAYNLVVENYKEVAVQISVLINKLTKYGSTLESFHFIGVSNILIKLLKSGPMFKSTDPFDHLDSSDALFVEAIHTDSDFFGISIPVGHVDFFLNGGTDQSGCASSKFASSKWTTKCMVINSWQKKSITCEGPFNGTCPQISLLKNKKVYLLTTATAPYCGVYDFVTSHLSGIVQLTLVTVGHPETELKLKLNTDEMVYKKVTAHPEQLCKIDSVQVKNTGARFYRQGDIHFDYICISEIPQTRGLDPLCVKNINIGRGVPWSHVFVQVC
uniref:Phospholipase A1 member A n=1 Tax=Cyprinus carpio TaxID=7962 RepID=A0A8C1TLZ9_CYPCA